MTSTRLQLAEEVVDPAEGNINAEFIAFLKAVSARRHPQGPIRRFNQGRAAGCARATFAVLDSVAPEHRVGLFAVPRTYDAWVRFASASSTSDREKDVRGLAIRIGGVAGENLTPGESRQDFVLNSHPVMPAPDTKQFHELLEAMEAGPMRRLSYFVSHPRAAIIGFRARQQPTSHLDIPYFSATPYLFGPGRAVKYIARPSPAPNATPPPNLTDTYLTDALRERLRAGDASFDFGIQLQTDARTMPIEDASVEWKEQDSPWRIVARIHIPSQEVGDPAAAACEQSEFNPWNSLVEHRPLGGMNRSRRDIYRALAELRRSRV